MHSAEGDDGETSGAMTESPMRGAIAARESAKGADGRSKGAQRSAMQGRTMSTAKLDSSAVLGVVGLAAVRGGKTTENYQVPDDSKLPIQFNWLPKGRDDGCVLFVQHRPENTAR